MPALIRHSYYHHFRATLILGLPLVAAQIAQMLIGVTDTIMVGWLGAEELAAGTLSFQFIFVLLIFGYGLGASMITLTALSLGSGRITQVRWTFRMGLWSLLGFSCLFQIVLWFSPEILLLLGQEPSIIALTSSYMFYAQWSLIPAFLYVGIRSFLTAIERPLDVLFIAILAIGINALLNYLLIFGNYGFPRLEISGAGLATLLTNTFMMLLGLLHLSRTSLFGKYKLFSRFAIPRWFTLGEVLRIGVPVGFAIFAETGLFMATSIMMGWVGTIALAAHGIALQIAGLAFMVPLGLAQAASVRVGRSYGSQNYDDITRASRSVLLITVCFSSAAILLFLSIPDTLIGVFLDSQDPDFDAIILYGVPLLWMAALFQLVDSLQVVAAGLLRGLKDTKVPLYIAIFSYWLIGVPTSYILGFWLKLDGVGIWGGLALGLAIASIFLIYRFSRRVSLGLL